MKGFAPVLVSAMRETVKTELKAMRKYPKVFGWACCRFMAPGHSYRPMLAYECRKIGGLPGAVV